MQLFIVRHGDPDYPNNTLTAAGHLEAKALATRMAAQIRPDELYSSPMGRAVATMRPTEEALGLTGTILPWAGELILPAEAGPWGASASAFDAHGQWIRDVPALPTKETWYQQAPFDVPKVRQEFERVCTASDDFLTGLGYQRQGGRYACIAPHRRKVVVFCHHGIGLTWLAHLLEIPLTLMWAGFWLPPSSVTTVLFDEREPEWAVPRCLGLGDLSHLHAAGLPRSNIGIKANRE